MDRIVTLLLVLGFALLLVPGCIAEEQGAPLAPDVAAEVPVAEEATEEVVEETTEETTEEVFAYNVSADVNTTELNMTLNQVALIQLSENPTTGFSWNVTLSDGLTLLSDRYVQDPTPEGMVGVGGVHEWYVEAVAAGNQTFDGIYKQPWEEMVGNETTYSLAILVE
ncbi:protease inhibitor I42 family protein [Methanospirillum hungatei]|uniref:protease inhibitor I42 family protein n=1 Tax=Methanospirillum hungatei TaxID=2203 RepID=UPI0026EE7A6D|nr:protease inhibitor I42 family protein [Methanospirillum hungatei]MCA1917214.1 protease inhibitor I42 family protein [Methanospirillum hungatei]